MSGQVDGFEVRSEVRSRRHAVIWLEDWDTPRMRMLPYATRCLYVTLCGYLGRYSGECWPKQSTLSHVTGLGERAVRLSISRLRELGYLRVERLPRGGKRINVYTILSPPPTRPEDTPEQP